MQTLVFGKWRRRAWRRSLGTAKPHPEGLPRFAYIGQIHSRQRVAEANEHILYSHNTNGLMPVLVAGSDNFDRELNCTMSAELAKWNLVADAVILARVGGGAPQRRSLTLQ
jgi:hypothetical protein